MSCLMTRLSPSAMNSKLLALRLYVAFPLISMHRFCAPEALFQSSFLSLEAASIDKIMYIYSLVLWPMLTITVGITQSSSEKYVDVNSSRDLVLGCINFVHSDCFC